MAKGPDGNLDCKVYRKTGFCCRICHSDEYKKKVGTFLYYCSGCTAVFEDPKLFSLTLGQKLARDSAQAKLEELARISVNVRDYRF